MMVEIREKMTRMMLVLILLTVLATTVSAQSVKEVKEMFAQAESYYLYGEYELANPLYLSIESFQPDNANILYKIGTCYLNIPDEKTKAIEYLEKAVKNASFDAKPTQLKEKRAPLDAYFYLGKAYMINNELDKAMNTFLAFQKLAGENKDKNALENIGFIDQQISACKNAIDFQSKPLNLQKTKLPDDFCMGSLNENPAVSFDGNTIVYTERRGLSNAIFYSKRERGKWQPPIEITNELKAGEDCSTCSLNSDGTVLFLYKVDNYDGNIYTSTLKDEKWTLFKN
ncbi:MAG: tetratricopeptide repeat protein [Bacteroidales bacterium]